MVLYILYRNTYIFNCVHLILIFIFTNLWVFNKSVCWEVPVHPGCMRIVKKHGRGQTTTNEITGIARNPHGGFESLVITNTVEKATLQIAAARIMLHLISMHPRYSESTQEAKEVIKKQRSRKFVYI